MIEKSMGGYSTYIYVTMIYNRQDVLYDYKLIDKKNTLETPGCISR